MLKFKFNWVWALGLLVTQAILGQVAPIGVTPGGYLHQINSDCADQLQTLQQRTELHHFDPR